MNNETIILAGLAAIFLTSNRGDHLLQNLGQQTQLTTAHTEIEAENSQASQTLAAERINSGQCLPTDQPIRPGMKTAIPLPTGTCLSDSQNMTAITNSQGELTQLARRKTP